MNLSISTCATERRITESGYAFEPVEGIRQCKEAGFRHIDFNFANAAKDGRPLSKDNWQQWVSLIRREISESGLTVSQTHAHWYKLSEVRSDEEMHWNEQMLYRSIWGAAKLGDCPWVVHHPLSVFDAEGYNAEKSREHNYAMLQKLGEYAEMCGARIAVENLFPAQSVGYCCCAEDLCELMERLPAETIGICWDFGHANRAGLDHMASLDAVAPHLKVTHCHDNKGKSDDHFIPYFGTVPWAEIMPKLKKRGYDGNLNMEVHVFYKTLPQSLRMDGLRFTRKIGEALIEEYNNA